MKADSNSNKNDSKEAFNPTLDQENILNFDFLNIQTLISTLKRRKRYFYVSFLSTFLLVFLYTIDQRIRNPIYTGFFTVLINDPINKSNGSRGIIGSTNPLLDQMARNTSTSDIPTLIEFLSSPVLFEDTAKK